MPPPTCKDAGQNAFLCNFAFILRLASPVGLDVFRPLLRAYTCGKPVQRLQQVSAIALVVSRFLQGLFFNTFRACVLNSAFGNCSTNMPEKLRVLSSGSWVQWTQKTQPSPCAVTLYLQDIGDTEVLSGADLPQQCRECAGGHQNTSYVTVFASFSLNDLSAARVLISGSQLDLIR